jgi:hypothetical protein
MAMGRTTKRKSEVSVPPVVLIKTLTNRPWVNNADPYSVAIMTASDTLLVTRVNPGVVLPANEDKGYGVFYVGKDTVEKDKVLYSSEVKGVYSEKLIPLVQTETTTYVVPHICFFLITTNLILLELEKATVGIFWSIWRTPTPDKTNR